MSAGAKGTRCSAPGASSGREHQTPEGGTTANARKQHNGPQARRQPKANARRRPKAEARRQASTQPVSEISP
eukprot:8091221-Alexandrium_andersonii.AAC.1